MKSPTGRQGICRLFNVGDVAPATVVQKRMGEFVSNHIVSERLGTVGQATPKDDTAAAAADRARRRHPQAPAFARNIGFQRDSKAGIIEKITLHRLGQSMQDRQDPASQRLTLGKCFQMSRKNLTNLRRLTDDVSTFSVEQQRFVYCSWLDTGIVFGG